MHYNKARTREEELKNDFKRYSTCTVRKIYLERVESNEVRNFPQNQIKVSSMNS